MKAGNDLFAPGLLGRFQLRVHRAFSIDRSGGKGNPFPPFLLAPLRVEIPPVLLVEGKKL